MCISLSLIVKQIEIEVERDVLTNEASIWFPPLSLFVQLSVGTR